MTRKQYKPKRSRALVQKKKGYTRSYKVSARDAETKYNNSAAAQVLSTQTNSTAGLQWETPIAYTSSLTDVSQGTTATTRVGNVIEAKWLEITGQCLACRCSMGDAAADVPDSAERPSFSRTVFRLIVFKDSQVNSTEVTIPQVGGQVLENNLPLTSAMLSIANLGRFKILAQKWITCDYDQPEQSFRFKIPLKGLKMRYNGPGGSPYNALQSNRIHFAFVAYSQGMSTATHFDASPTLTYWSRLAFTDN